MSRRKKTHSSMTPAHHPHIKSGAPGGYNASSAASLASLATLNMTRERPNLILASASPRRSELLTSAGFEFEVMPANVAEDHDGSEPPAPLVERLAQAKASDVAGRLEANAEAVVLGADTIVVLGGKILGKPVSEDDARRMLTALSGREHEVVTGVALVAAGGGRTVTAHDVTRVVFRALTEPEIENYVRGGEPMDKAGAYAIQGIASRFVTRIEGSYSNVMGLPVELVDRMLREW